MIAGPPYIRVIKPKYTISSGSEITLACRIVNYGEPRASFGWTKNGKVVDSSSVTINESFISITLTNVTITDAGIYTCIANGIESHHNDSVQLYVTSVKGT